MAIRPENQDARNRILSIVKRRNTKYRTVFVQGAFTHKKGKTWKNCLTKITALDSKVTQATSFEYDTFSYVEGFMTLESIPPLVDTLLEKGLLVIADYPVRLVEEVKLPDTILFRESQYLSTQNSFMDVKWPTDFFWCQGTGDFIARPPHDRLVDLDKPLYPDAYKLIEHKMGVDLVKSDGFIGAVLFLFPNYQAKIAGLKIGMQNVLVEVLVGRGKLNNLLAKVYARNERKVCQTEVPFEKDEQAIHIGFRPLELEVCILDKGTGELIDQRWFNPYTIGSQAPTGEWDEEFVRHLVNGGEDLHVEFKPNKRDERDKEEWAETAIAFANKEGGIILIGVRDNGTIEGVQGAGIEDVISKSVRDRCEPPIEPVIRQVMIEDKYVYIVQVKEGSNKPHFRRGKGVAFIRSGSTDRPMSRYELDEVCNDRLRASQGFPDLPRH